MSDPQDATDEIAIPESARHTKAWFLERPDEGIKNEILKFIRDRNPVYLCNYHTHTKPPRGARVEYIGEFDVHKDMPMAPCPCCCPVKPKYREDGKIAWFPDEGVIRLIGPDCFKTLNPEGHAEALQKLHLETKRRQTTNYLLSRVGDIPKAIKTITRSLEVAKAVDWVHPAVLKALREHNVQLWDHVRSSKLLVNEYGTVTEEREDGTKYNRVTHDIREYATLDGVIFFSPNLKVFATRLTEAKALLETIDLGEDQERTIREAADFERDGWAKAIFKGVDKATRVTDELGEARRALSPVMIGTLRRWGTHPHTRCSVFIKREGNDLLVGASENSYTRLKRALVDVWEPLDALPDFGKADE